MIVNRIIYPSLSALFTTVILAISSESASAITVTQPFNDFSGTFSSVDLVIDGELLSTGEISVSLDPTLKSTVTFDTDSSSSIFDLNLLLNFPLLGDLGENALPINIIETGPYTINETNLIANVTGGGTVVSESLFAGVTFSNSNDWDAYIEGSTPIFKGGLRWRYRSNGQVDPPSGSPSSPIEGTGEAVSVPWETDALSVVGSTVLFGLGVWTKRKRKLSKSSEKDNTKDF